MSERRSKRLKREEDSHKEVEYVSVKNEGEEVEHIHNYEQIRQENMQRNLQFLDSIGIQDVKSDLRIPTDTKPSSRGLLVSKRKPPQSDQPPRRSGRVTIERLKKEIAETVANGDSQVDEEANTLLHRKRDQLEVMVADKAASTFIAQPPSVDNGSVSRHSPDPIPLLLPLNQPKKADDSHSPHWGHGLLPLLQSSVEALTCSGGAEERGTAAYRSSMASLQVKETDVAKVVPQRITSMALHPAMDHTLVIAGDKSGHIGFWNADEARRSQIDSGCLGSGDSGGEDGVYLYRPHVGSVSGLHVPPHCPENLLSASYDGTLRRMDIEQQAFVEAFRSPGEYDEVRFHDMAFGSSPGSVLLGCHSGEVVMVDLRSGAAEWTAQAHEGKINSVQVHPALEHVLVSASTGMTGFIAVHDLRKVPTSSSSSWKPLFTLDAHSRSINAAYLSPHRGEFLVSVSLDNTVKVWKDIMTSGISKAGTRKPTATSFAHNNHTGRWLSTLKPSFDPTADASQFSSFSLGSLAKPRRVELFTLPSSSSSPSAPAVDPVIDLSGEHVGSVCSRNCFHPRRSGVIAGGNSSGRVHVFR